MATIKNAILGAAAVSLVSAIALAGTPAYTVSSHYKTVFSLGIQWDFNDMRPQLVAGVRRAETTAREAVRGGKIDVAIPLSMDMSFDPTVRLLGLSGGRDVQGELGFGWRVRAGEFMASVGVQAPYSNAGVNFAFNGPIKPYLGVNTIGRAPAAFKNPVFIPLT